MKPIVIDEKCGASEGACKALKACPVGAIRYTKTDEEIKNRSVACGSGCDSGCECGGCGDSLVGKIVIDYDKCTSCGLCVNECCGGAIEMSQ